MRFMDEHPLRSYVWLVVAALFVSMALTIALDFSAATGAMLCFVLIGGGYVVGTELTARAQRSARADLEESKLRRLREQSADLERQQQERKPREADGR
ncbi:MAG: hypothetical protein HY826_01145 [Actinobacteria bacterium]|nr:hypothetical protein [Actinomycetota bacterium]